MLIPILKGQAVDHERLAAMAALAMMLILGTLGGIVIAVLGHPKVYRLLFPKSKVRSLDR